jgi:hypothetical protein
VGQQAEVAVDQLKRQAEAIMLISYLLQMAPLVNLFFMAAVLFVVQVVVASVPSQSL